MATHFYKLRVNRVQPETSQSVVVTFEVPPALQATFAYLQGKYLALRTYLQGREVRRNYSLCSSPLDKEWTIAISESHSGQWGTYRPFRRSGPAARSSAAKLP
jgi:ring-1,2-phenylacetyl-CoA epoxidase subunit PaaE